MAQNKIPGNRGQISGAAQKMKAGLVALGVLLGITQITTASFGVLLAAFNSTFGTYNSARSSRQTAYNLFHQKEADLVAWLKVVRGILTGDFGSRWNTMWAQAGFVQPHTAIPERSQDRISLAVQLANFFTTHPEYEVTEKDVTAAKATALHDAVIAAQDALQTANVTLKTASDTLNTAQAALVSKMQALVDILRATLGASDPRWHAFGLNIPSARTTPGQPTGLHATVVDPQIILANDATPLAQSYRYRGRIVGLESRYRLLATAEQPMAMLSGIEPGVTVEFIVQAVNGGSQGVASDPIEVTMPLATAPVATAPLISKAELAPLMAITPNGNGNGNGKTNASSAAVSRRG